MTQIYRCLIHHGKQYLSFLRFSGSRKSDRVIQRGWRRYASKIQPVNNKPTDIAGIKDTSALKSEIVDNSDLVLPRDGKPLRCTKDQWLYLPSPREIELFQKSSALPSRPIDVEGSVIIRLVDLQDSVTSPLGRSMFYSQYGLRKGELLRIIAIGSFCCAVMCSLGYWQLKRFEWKTTLLEGRKAALSEPLVKIDSFHQFEEKLAVPNNSSTEYRSVECTGVLDTSCRILVGPRPSLYHTYGDTSGYNVVYPVRFRDGSTALVNMGWLGNEEVMGDDSCPELVTLRGVAVKGEIRDSLISSLKLKMVEAYKVVMSKWSNGNFPPSETYINKPSQLIRDGSVRVYTYLDPLSLSQDIYSTSPMMTGMYILNVYDILYHDDRQEISKLKDDGSSQFKPKSAVGRSLRSKRPHYQMRQKSDYLLFYASPETHLNYAAQWFLMAASIAGMCIYKMFRIRKSLKTPF